jgi:hypothetical protein
MNSTPIQVTEVVEKSVTWRGAEARLFAIGRGSVSTQY